MTRQEAIHELYDIFGYGFYNEKVDEALNMAIKALEHEQNCVKCKSYYETEDDDGVHSNCKQEQLICKYCIHCAVKGEFAKYRYCDMWDSVVNANGYCNYYGEKHEQV